MSDEFKSVDISDLPLNPTIGLPESAPREIPTVVHKVYQVACYDPDCLYYGVWDDEFLTRREANRMRDWHLKEYHALLQSS